MSAVAKEKKAKVLVVEDERPLRELLQNELTRSGYVVVTAADGDEGLTRYQEEIFNVVLLDVRMPGTDGVEILRQMRSESQIPEVIMFTGHGNIETAVECIKNGAYDYLTKPVKLDELEMVIDKASEKNRLRLENINLRLEVEKFESNQIVGRSQVLRDVLNMVGRLGPTDEHVLIHGESGTGKELIARAVHDASGRTEKPFLTVNCGRLNVHTAESELFGHMQGAFTSASKGRAGLFELADTGTLFMDEISEMPLDVQVKLLRILETGTFRRLGGNRDITVDVRFVFASNKNLLEAVEQNLFREDLYHRINLLPLDLPPLRKRPEDILPLALYFLKSACDSNSDNWEISDEAVAAIRAYSWPGNVRELKNAIRRACILAPESIITSDLLPFSVPRNLLTHNGKGDKSRLADAEKGNGEVPLWVIERDHIRRVIEKTDGNKSKAAKILEIDRKTLYTKLERYGLMA